MRAYPVGNQFNSPIEKPSFSEEAEPWIQRGQLGFFTMVFGFFTTPGGKEALMEHAAVAGLPAQVFLFPIAALLEMAEAAAAWHVFITARNQNLGKLLDALKKTQKAIIVSTAITLGTIAVVAGITALTIFVAPLFIIAVGMHALYHAGVFIQSAYKHYRAPKGSALRAHYRKKMIANGIRTVVGVVLTVVIAGLFLVGVSTGVGLAVVAGVGIAAAVGAVTASVVLNKPAATDVNLDLAGSATVKSAVGKAATNASL